MCCGAGGLGVYVVFCAVLTFWLECDIMGIGSRVRPSNLLFKNCIMKKKKDKKGRITLISGGLSMLIYSVERRSLWEEFLWIVHQGLFAKNT